MTNSVGRYRTLVVATWLNVACLTIQLSQVAIYFRRFPGDGVIIRSAVVFTTIANIVATALELALAYLVRIKPVSVFHFLKSGIVHGHSLGGSAISVERGLAIRTLDCYQRHEPIRCATRAC